MRRRKWLTILTSGFLFSQAHSISTVLASNLETQNQTSNASINAEFDVLIIGAGGAGLSAAVAAREAGAKRVAILEKSAIVGGHTMLSAGTVTVASDGDRTVQELMNDIVAMGGRRSLARTLAEQSGATLQWLSDMDVAWEAKLFRAVGSGTGTPRNLSTGSQRGGWDIVQALASRARKLGVEIYFEHRAIKLIQDSKTHHIVGVVAKTLNGKEKTIFAHAIVIASGGFSASQKLQARFAPNIPTVSGSTADTMGMTPDLASGDGIRMGEEVGAKLVDMDAIECIPYTGGRVLDFAGAEIWLNAEGDRFVNEEASFDVIAGAMQNQTGGFMWTITDAKSKKGANFGTKLVAGIVREASSLTVLAKETGISYEKLVDTMTAYNNMATTGHDPQFGRTTFNQTIDTPPYYFGIERLSVHFTMGGLLIDEKTRVLDHNEHPIPGLFAAGETTGGVHGRKRLSGNALTEAFVFGRIAGREATMFVQEDRLKSDLSHSK
ncbi:MAG: flavocytochrome c [Burkholderiaceae bacterium]|nr:flavocytochrome c [Burkholderiaceae bacterium]